MRNLFHLDNPFVQLLSRVGDMILANVLFLLCSVPVFTLGASVAALNKVTQDIVYDRDSGIVKTFFRAFRENFGQATITWLVMLAFFVGMGCNYLIVVSYFTGNLAMILKAVLLLIAVLIISICVYLFPLMVRYANGLRDHCMNAAILMIVKLPKTILMDVLTLLPLLIAYLSMKVFVQTLIFWVVIGFAFLSYSCSNLLTPVFKELEGENGPNVGVLQDNA